MRLTGRAQVHDFHADARTHDDINNPSSPIYQVLRLSHQLESQIRGYQYYSGAASATMIHTAFPTVSYAEDILPIDKKTLIAP
jgi:hypothetical protein